MMYIDPDGRSPVSALKIIAKNRERIHAIAKLLDVDPMAIASVIFQEKYAGVFADLKNMAAFVIDGGVNDKTSETRSYGLAEMQIGLAAELLGIDLSKPGAKKEVYKALLDDNCSIGLIGLNIKKNEKEMNVKLKGATAGYLHNMGVKGYRDFINGKKREGYDRVPKRSLEYQNAIRDALNGKINPKKDDE